VGAGLGKVGASSEIAIIVSAVKPVAALAAALLLAACQTVPQSQAPKGRAMVAAANPLAVEAGLKVLRAGGSAVDAAVAVQAVLGLVEPQSSSLAGGAFMTYYDARSGEVVAYDGRETAPAGATPDMFLDASGKPMGFAAAVLSGRSTGVPGAIAMLSMAQHQQGRLAWNSLFADGEKLAETGFVVSPRLAAMIAGPFPQNTAPDTIAYFTGPDGGRLKAGDVLKNPAYADSLRRIAAEGPKALLEGPLAQAIVARVRQEPTPGAMTLADLKGYKPKAGAALCRPYRLYVVCTPSNPSGGPALLEALGILAQTDIDKRGPGDPQAWYLFAQASRLMYADRDRYMGDPAFVEVPTEGLLDPDYLAARARLIGPSAGPPPAPGHPKGAGVRAPDATLEPGGTSHMVIVDGRGNVVSMTTTVESIFGSGRMTGGFFLNNQLTDFSFAPQDDDGVPAANAVAPGKRPRSSMAPVIVLDRKGAFVAALGSPGGSSILAYNLKTVVGVLDWGLSMQDAVSLPNLIARGGTYAAEVNKFPPAVLQGLKARGMTLTPGRGEDSGIQGVLVRNGRLEGGADPRREGAALSPD